MIWERIMVLVNKPVATNAPAQDDIAVFVTSLEKLNSRAAAEASVRDLLEAREKNIVMLGAVLAKLQANDNWWDEGHPNFKDYVESTFGIKYRRAMYAMEIYKKLLMLGLPWSAFDGIGWTKVNILLEIVTKENAPEWVEKAKVVNLFSLRAMIDKAKKAKVAGEVPETADVVSVIFKLHPDQKEIFDAAIDKAQKETGTDVKSVALEAIAQNYMGSGISFADWRQALAFARKHMDTTKFATEVIAEVEKLCPELVINCAIDAADDQQSNESTADAA